MSEIEIFSYGGGVQSNGGLVLAARGEIRFRRFVFANVGDDSEHPGTLAYIRHVGAPYAEYHGIELVQLHRQRRDGRTETLFGRLTKEGSRSLPIPVRMPDTGAPGTRSCTMDFKIRVIGKYLKSLGASPANKATVAVGISLDEIHRINARKAQPYEILAYPLVGVEDGRAAGIGAMRLRRADCEQIVLDEPLPAPLVGPLKAVIDAVDDEGEYILPKVTRNDLLASGFTKMPRPPKSACWYCPFHRPSEWARQRREEPKLFAQACDLENLLNHRRDELGRDRVYLTRFGKPLAEAIPATVSAEQENALDDISCDNGFCMT